MSAMPAVCLTDNHVCPMVTPGVPPVPHVGGPVVQTAATTILIANKPASDSTGQCICTGPPDVATIGSSKVLFKNLPVMVSTGPSAHGGTLIGTQPKVLCAK